ncbi:MAG TPA: hypothetical protein PLE16_09440 [Spirochaetota bacterium]|nr:hypothetical protein [Spirochaetota bacterium]
MTGSLEDFSLISLSIAGRYSVKTVPEPISDSTSICPQWFFTIEYEIARPRPCPVGFVVK